MDRDDKISIVLLGTHVIDYYTYVDLVSINGEVKTQLFRKNLETKNEFVLDKDLPGDKMQQIIDEVENVSNHS